MAKNATKMRHFQAKISKIFKSHGKVMEIDFSKVVGTMALA